MQFKTGLCAVVAAGTLASSASAAIVTFTQQFLWESFSTYSGAALHLEDFNGYSGFYPTLQGGTGPVVWDASASGGLYVQGGVFSTSNPVPLSFSFTNSAGGGVQGVSGNFFATDVGFNVVPAIVFVSLADGTTYAGVVDAATAFTGFYSTGALITGLTFTAQPLPGSPAVYPSVDNMRFATVPSPGAIALLAAAGLVSRRRR